MFGRKRCQKNLLSRSKDISINQLKAPFLLRFILKSEKERKKLNLLNFPNDLKPLKFEGKKKRDGNKKALNKW